MGNTHDLSGDRAAGRALNAKPRTHGFCVNFMQLPSHGYTFYSSVKCSFSVSTVQIQSQDINYIFQSDNNILFTSRKLSMAGTGYSMMRRRKVYRPRQDSMKVLKPMCSTQYNRW